MKYLLLALAMFGTANACVDHYGDRYTVDESGCVPFFVYCPGLGDDVVSL